MGGEHGSSGDVFSMGVGSSPHGRGTRWHWDARYETHRIIPAWAGNTRTASASSSGPSDHPRMGGEHRGQTRSITHHVGSSPHGRGTLHTGCRPLHSVRIIPAWAGNTTTAPDSRPGHPDHPRMGGEHSSCIPTQQGQNGSSPHGRGTQRREPAVFGIDRIIPAWAGNTSVTGME